MWTEARHRFGIGGAGFVVATREGIRGRDGNHSCRVGDDRVVMSPRRADTGSLLEQGLVLCTSGSPTLAGALAVALVAQNAVAMLKLGRIAVGGSAGRAVYRGEFLELRAHVGLGRET